MNALWRATRPRQDALMLHGSGLAIVCVLVVGGAACTGVDDATGLVGAADAEVSRAPVGASRTSSTFERRCPAPCAQGRVVRDHRRVDTAGKRLGPVEVVPVVDLEVTVRRRGAVLGRAWTDLDGRFRIPLRAPPGPALELSMVAAVREELGAETGEGDGEGVTLAVFDGVGVPVPRQLGELVQVARPWAWVTAPVDAARDPTDFGEVHIDEAAGAGALALLEQIRGLRATVATFFGRARSTSLAVLWSPALVPSCLSCYLPDGWGPIVWATSRGQVSFDRAVFFSGAPSAPHHFTPSLVAHELGHWALDLVSGHPEAGGGHGWDQLVAPPLAWSEGFSTFFAQWALSTPEAPVSRFFAIQSHVQYWVDLEGIGRGASADDSSVGVDFPRPDPHGGLTQPLNEAVVAAMLWDLWDAPGRGGDDEPIALGDDALEVIAAARMLQLDRGARDADLVDYLDALACDGMIDGVDLGAALLGFPWDGAPLCP